MATVPLVEVNVTKDLGEKPSSDSPTHTLINALGPPNFIVRIPCTWTGTEFRFSKLLTSLPGVAELVASAQGLEITSLAVRFHPTAAQQTFGYAASYSQPASDQFNDLADITGWQTHTTGNGGTVTTQCELTPPLGTTYVLKPLPIGNIHPWICLYASAAKPFPITIEYRYRFAGNVIKRIPLA